MPPTAQARAATNHTYISLNNSSAPRSWESRFIAPNGLILNTLELDQPGVMVNEVNLAQRFYDASGPFRQEAIDGKWHSGEVVDDPRSTDRRSY